MGVFRHLAVLCVCLATFGIAGTATAQTVSFLGVNRALPEIQSQLLEGSLFPAIVASQAGLQDCEANRVIVMGPKSAHPARARLAAVQRLQECVAEVRSSVVAASGANASAAVLSFQSTEQLLDKKAAEAGAETDFMGMSFGVGVGVSYSQDKIVSEAEIAADNTIRATKVETQEPRVILESHYFGFCKSARCNEGAFGVGPFFGIVAKDDKLISAFAAGVMVGWKDSKLTNASGFSVGLGAILDSNVKSLAAGFEEGKPLPAGETAPKFTEKSRWGVILFFTRTF